MANSLHEVFALGQSIWFDHIHRTFIRDGGLKRLIEQDGVRGVTSNPAIFAKAIGDGSGYLEELSRLAQHGGLDAKAIYEHLAVTDTQDACDQFAGVYASTQGRDGFVSLEVSPVAADDTAATIVEARRLWTAVGRPNAMIKIPATPAGIPAIETCIADGININVTLLFARETYESVAEAFITGLERLAFAGGNVGSVSSVASFFVSRIDTRVDELLRQKITGERSDTQRTRLEGLLGEVAIANARLTYQRYKELIATERWRKLATRGAQPQRLLWASTSTKNPAYRDVYYVEELIGPETIDTVPPATLDAFRDHGRAALTLERDIEGARRTMQTLEEVGISMKTVTDAVLADAVRLFVEPFGTLLDAVERQRRAALGTEHARSGA